MALESARVRSLALIATLAALSACTLEPRYHAPALPVGQVATVLEAAE